MGNLEPIVQVYAEKPKSLNLSAVYAIKNLDNGKVYVGSAVNLRRRTGGHLNDLSKGKHHSVYLQRAWDLHGADRFTLIILEEVEVQELLDCEQHWMDTLKCCDKKHGYNIYPTAGSALGVKHRPEVRQAMSRQRRGRKVSLESRKHMREAQRERFAKAPMSEATKRRIGSAKKGRKLSEEHRQKIGEAMKGRQVSAKTRAKLSQVFKGRDITEEHRLKMIETQSALTKKKHHRACEMWHDGRSLKAISQALGIAVNTASRYVNGVTQKHWYADWEASRGIEVKEKRYRRLSRGDVFEIFEMRRQGMYQREIAEVISNQTGCDIGRTTIDNTLNSRSYAQYAEDWLTQQK